MFELSAEEHEDVRKKVLEKTPMGWFKLNTDGSSIQHRGLAGGGGLIRDAFENWVIGFSSRFDFTSNIIAKLLALEHSHQVCQMPNIWHLAHQTPKNPSHEVFYIL